MTSRQGFIAVLLSSVCFGFLGYFGKYGYSLGYTPLRLLTVRFALASAMMWFVAWVRMMVSGNSQQAKLVSYRLDMHNTKWLVIQGVAYAFTALGIFNAYRYLPAGVVGVLFFVHPLLTIAAAKLLWNEPITKRLGQSAVLAVIGVALVSQTGNSG